MSRMLNRSAHSGRAGLLVMLLALFAAGCGPERDPAAKPTAEPAAEPDWVAIAPGVPSQEPGYDPARDYFSYANRDGMTVRHVALDLDVDFERTELRGHAVLHVEPTKSAKVTAIAQVAERAEPPAIRSLTLDSRGLEIEGAWLLRDDGRSDALQYGAWPNPPDPVRGQAMVIMLPQEFEPEGRFQVRVAYRTGRDASAIMWLPPELTAGGRHPFMFTQSQSIHARSWVPLQDTPSVRFTYEAVIRTPPGLRALMSADNDPAAESDGEYRFTMPQPIPSYLLALAVGHLDFAPFGDRTGVYAEPEILPQAAREFADTQAMLEAAEALYGPYIWGRYDLLILPPAFPYGGMENPRLSFLTPSLIAGDGSLVSTVAHELAHSWSGNLVSNATWRDIWLNEGVTTYLEGRLMEVIYSRERADEERVLSYRALLELFETVPEAMQPLAPRFDQGDPDVGQDGLEYSKGQLLLDTLEQKFGRTVFDEFLADYFQAFQWQAITTEQFLGYVDERLLQRYPGFYSRDRLEAWLYHPGIPEDAVLPASASLDRAAQAAAAYAAGERSADGLRAEDWSPMAAVHFIQALPEELETEEISVLDAALDLSAGQNAEIARGLVHTGGRMAPPARLRADAEVPRALRPHPAAGTGVPGLGREWAGPGMGAANLRVRPRDLPPADGRGHRAAVGGPERGMSGGRSAATPVSVSRWPWPFRSTSTSRSAGPFCTACSPGFT
jgi:hypothetical protein